MNIHYGYWLKNSAVCHSVCCLCLLGSVGSGNVLLSKTLFKDFLFLPHVMPSVQFNKYIVKPFVGDRHTDRRDKQRDRCIRQPPGRKVGGRQFRLI